MTFMARLQANPQISTELLKAVVGLLGDLAQTFGRRVSHLFSQPFVSLLIQQGSQDEDAMEISGWARAMITATL